jgi:hypothetical protein
VRQADARVVLMFNFVAEIAERAVDFELLCRIEKFGTHGSIHFSVA